MNIEDLEEALEDILPPGFSIETNSKGRIVIITNLIQDDDGELVDAEGDDDDDEEDPDFDPDFEPLEDEDEDEE